MAQGPDLAHRVELWDLACEHGASAVFGVSCGCLPVLATGRSELLPVSDQWWTILAHSQKKSLTAAL